jgi:hypothetical protein
VVERGRDQRRNGVVQAQGRLDDVEVIDGQNDLPALTL